MMLPSESVKKFYIKVVADLLSFPMIWPPEEDEAEAVDVVVDMVLSWIHLRHRR
jgi:hypothetical protein